MHLIVDLGNTFSKIAWFDENRLVETQYKLPYEVLLEKLRQLEHVPQRAIVSSTGSPASEIAQILTQQNYPVVLLDAQTPVPIKKNY